MKKTIFKPKRGFWGMLLVMAFMIIGAQQAEAQYMHPSEALSKIDQQVSQIMSAPAVVQLGLDDGTSIDHYRLEYVSGVAVALKEDANVQVAIDNSHDAFLEKYPNSAAVANQLKAETTALLEE